MMPAISGETAGTETNPLENPVLYEMKKMPGPVGRACYQFW